MPNSCETFFFYGDLSLNALPVHLLRQVLFYVLLFYFCQGALLSVSGGPLWVIGSIWGPFGSDFGDFLRMRWIFENVCFTIVKPYFLRSGKVLDRDFFVLCF